jgi:hypothetical protein
VLANKAIRRVHDFTYLGSNVSEDGGTYKDVKTRIQKARGAFTRFRKIWQAYINKDRKIKLFNAYVKSELLYGCQAGYMWNPAKASVLCKHMLAKYYEDLVVQGYIQ